MMKTNFLNIAISFAVFGLFAAAISKSEKHSLIHPLIPRTGGPVIDSTDAATGLALDSNLPLVKAQCTSCHSPMLILQHRFTRDEWLSKIRWMQRNHKLWDLGESEKPVLDYLAKHYAPNQSAYSRREPLRNVKWYKLEK
jgi:hypothetical protein